jgi:hypothetical protein
MALASDTVALSFTDIENRITLAIQVPASTPERARAMVALQSADIIPGVE